MTSRMTTDRAREHMRELGSTYEAGREAIIDLVEGLDARAASTTLPACPAWSVHDVVAHMTGICADVLAGKIGGAATDDWTAAQVDARRSRSIGELIEEWDDVGPRFAAMIDDFPGRVRYQPIADITVHEHDIRGALDRPGNRTSDRVALALQFFAEVLIRPGVTALGLGPLEVRAGDDTWLAGTGDRSTSDMDEAFAAALWSDDPSPTATPAVATLAADPFELFRALPGRRSVAQIRGFEWSVDPGPFLPIFGFGPFTTRATDLVE